MKRAIPTHATRTPAGDILYLVRLRSDRTKRAHSMFAAVAAADLAGNGIEIDDRAHAPISLPDRSVTDLVLDLYASAGNGGGL